jgi:predicted MPP superfamily phosphohydrolase
MEEFKILKIYWQGPYSIDECVQKFSDYKTDYGIYQIYGNHPVNGMDNLLYIGKSDELPFKTRFLKHKKDWIDKEASEVEIYVGRFYDTVLPDNKRPEDKEWGKYINACEKMLIYHCQPSYNIREKYLPPTFSNEEYILLNIGKRHRLPAEISTYFLKNFGTLNPDTIWKYGNE